MKIFEITETSSKFAFKRQGSKISRKYRCTTGPRKGQVRASPAACNAPINIKKKQTLSQTKAKLGSHRAVKRSRTMATNTASIQTRRLNKSITPNRRKKMR